MNEYILITSTGNITLLYCNIILNNKNQALHKFKNLGVKYAQQKFNKWILYL